MSRQEVESSAALGRATASERNALWNHELLNRLLALQEEPGQPVLLACDDEVVRVVAERLGLEPEQAVPQLASDAAVVFSIGRIAGFEHARVSGARFASAPRPRLVPEFLSLLCLCVLAASRMAPGEARSTHAYYPLLRDLFNLQGRGEIPHFDCVPHLFAHLAGWLDEDLAGARGKLLVPDDPHPPWVGTCVAQTVFRRRDREVLSEFFAERMAGEGDGYDPLRRLRRWSGRHALTHHALELVEDETMAERVRAAIRSAYAAWDGSVLSASEGGRLWLARLRLLPYPLRLHAFAGNGKPIDFSFGERRFELAPGGAVELPWMIVERLRERPLVAGDPRSAAGALRLPCLGAGALFELGEEGLSLVERPSGERVWILTCERALQKQLERFRFQDGGVLPSPWQLLRDVPLEELPQVERAPAARSQASFALAGGLPLEPRVYLSGSPPLLAAGDLEDLVERIAVSVNGQEIGRVGSGERLELPCEPGSYELVVGDGEWRACYSVEERGAPSGVGSLGHLLEGPRALRSGTRPLASATGTSVCGATISTPYEGDLPILTRAANLVTIDAAGAGQLHARPPTPTWFQEVGLGDGRWEVVRPDVVWVLCPPARPGTRGWARQLRFCRFEAIDETAAQAVRALGDAPTLNSPSADDWQALVALARGKR